jgi:hypothetical protein
MKNKPITVALIIFCFVVAIQQMVTAQSKQVQATNERIKLKVMPELNAKLPVKRREIKYPTSLMMTASGGIKPSFEAEFEGIEFTVCTDYKSKRISFISTSDERFETSEGIAVNDTLQRVLETSQGELIKERGWAFFVKLKSGWSAAFVQGQEATEGELPPEAKVAFLFKR